MHAAIAIHYDYDGAKQSNYLHILNVWYWTVVVHIEIEISSQSDLKIWG
jgi:hypothetical protein